MKCFLLNKATAVLGEPLKRLIMHTFQRPSSVLSYVEQVLPYSLSLKTTIKLVSLNFKQSMICLCNTSGKVQVSNKQHSIFFMVFENYQQRIKFYKSLLENLEIQSQFILFFFSFFFLYELEKNNQGVIHWLTFDQNWYIQQNAVRKTLASYTIRLMTQGAPIIGRTLSRLTCFDTPGNQDPTGGKIFLENFQRRCRSRSQGRKVFQDGARARARAEARVIENIGDRDLSQGWGWGSEFFSFNEKQYSN